MSDWLFLFTVVVSLVNFEPATAAETMVNFEKRDNSLVIRVDSKDVATYVFRDEHVPRPYFAHVKTTTGVQVTRNHPPRKDQDAVDHDGLHTGIWLSFGDLSGNDYWRLKARTEHLGFAAEPVGGSGQGTFAVRNRYLSTDGKSTVCDETCRYIVKSIPQGYLIEMASEFRPGQTPLIFGDQEEMGLGIRLATPLAVDRKLGGRILDSAGRKNGKEVWGQTAEWCDYSGPLADQWVGLTILTGPDNFHPCWSHARDYGFLTMNPFGRNAFTKQPPSQLIVKPGEVFRLHFSVVVHASATEAEYRPAEIYADFAKSGKPQPQPAK